MIAIFRLEAKKHDSLVGDTIDSELLGSCTYASSQFADLSLVSNGRRSDSIPGALQEMVKIQSEKCAGVNLSTKWQQKRKPGINKTKNYDKTTQPNFVIWPQKGAKLQSAKLQSKRQSESPRAGDQIRCNKLKLLRKLGESTVPGKTKNIYTVTRPKQTSPFSAICLRLIGHAPHGPVTSTLPETLQLKSQSSRRFPRGKPELEVSLVN